MSALLFICYAIFQQVYCISIVFMQLVGYFISYSPPKRTQIKTDTHIFLFTWFELHQSIPIYLHYYSITESIVVQRFQNIKDDTMVSSLLLIWYTRLEQFYCISVVFGQLVGYLIYYSLSEHFHIKTHTNNFLFTLFLSHQSILIYYHYFMEPEYIVVQKFQNIKDNTTVSKLLFICYI